MCVGRDAPRRPTTGGCVWTGQDGDTTDVDPEDADAWLGQLASTDTEVKLSFVRSLGIEANGGQ